MAESDVVRQPTVVTEEPSLSQTKIKLLVDGLIPPAFGNKKKPKNGTADVIFSTRGFDMKASVRKSDTQETKWQYVVRKLPSEIEVNKSTWKVGKGMIIITIEKKEEISWAAMLRRGLEQADSSDEEKEPTK